MAEEKDYYIEYNRSKGKKGSCLGARGTVGAFGFFGKKSFKAANEEFQVFLLRN